MIRLLFALGSWAGRPPAKRGELWLSRQEKPGSPGEYEVVTIGSVPDVFFVSRHMLASTDKVLVARLTPWLLVSSVARNWTLALWRRFLNASYEAGFLRVHRPAVMVGPENWSWTRTDARCAGRRMLTRGPGLRRGPDGKPTAKVKLWKCPGCADCRPKGAT